MKYYTVIDGVETLVTADKQMFDCIAAGGDIFSEDESGTRKQIADGTGFFFGRPGILVRPPYYKPPIEEVQ